LLHREALNYGLDLEPQRFEQDEPARVMTKELHTEAGRILTVPQQSEDPPSQTDNAPPHLPHARWETATATATATATTVAMEPEASTAGSVNIGQYVYKWQLGEWSKCSQQCGAAGSGLQVSFIQQLAACALSDIMVIPCTSIYHRLNSFNMFRFQIGIHNTFDRYKSTR